MESTVDTAITRVTVYPDRARVTCSGVCELTAGRHQLLIEELPLVLDPDSVRISGQGTARVRLLGVDMKRRYYEETPAARVRQLEQEIEQLEDESRLLEDDKAGWNAHATYVDGLRRATAEYAKGLARGRTTIDDQAGLVAFIQEQDGELRAAMRELDVKQREVSRRLQKHRRELEHLRAARPRRRFQAQIEVEVTEAGALEPELSYVVSQAGWQPLYDFRLFEREDGYLLDGTYLAQVKQNTGQDWTAVALTVSTARPALSQRLPELQPWYVDEYRRPPAPQARAERMKLSAPMPAASVMEAEEAADMEEPVPAEIAVAAVSESGTAVTFSVAGETDIPSDGSSHKVTLNRFELDAAVDYFTVPKHTDAVYRRAVVNNDSSSPLMPGPVALFVGDQFIGRSKLDHTPTGGEFELLMGVEERITVERELMKREVDKRFIRDRRSLRYGYRTIVKNLLPRTVTVEVHDQAPVSRHEDIKVKIENVKPEPAERSDLNLLEWRLALVPDSKQMVNIEYTVEHPRSMRVIGLLD